MSIKWRPGQLDGVNPALALGHGIGSHLVLPLVLPSVHDPEAELKNGNSYSEEAVLKG